MREIKFRAWDEKAKTMRYPSSVDNSGNFYCGIDEGVVVVDRFIDSDWHPLILQQYTGLHDKNGREIYEGDIIECFCEDGREHGGSWIERHDIRWDSDGACFVIGDNWERLDCDAIENLEIRVIGNIYDSMGAIGGERETK